jgi:hypothetical protein
MSPDTLCVQSKVTQSWSPQTRCTEQPQLQGEAPMLPLLKFALLFPLLQACVCFLVPALVMG